MGKLKGKKGLWNIHEISQISDLLLAFNDFLPTEIHRKFRHLKHIHGIDGIADAAVCVTGGTAGADLGVKPKNEFWIASVDSLSFVVVLELELVLENMNKKKFKLLFFIISDFSIYMYLELVCTSTDKLL